MIYIILAMLLYAVAIMFATTASRNSDTNLAAAVINIVSGIVPVLVVIPVVTKKMIVSQKMGIIYGIIAGVLIALFVMSINKAYSVNKVGIVAPIVFGGAIFLSTIMSYFIFKEKVTLIQTVGLVFLGIGFSIIIYARATAH